MTDAAALGLGYSPPRASPRSESSASSVEEVVLMANGSDGGGEQGGEKVEFVTAAPQASVYRSMDGDDGNSDESPTSLSGGGDSSSGIKTEARRAGPVVGVTTEASGAATASLHPVTPTAPRGSHSAKRKAQQQQQSSITPRRSKRIKQKAPPPVSVVPAATPNTTRKSPVKTKMAGPDGLEAHFDVVEETGDAAPHLQCKHCGRKLMHRKGAPARHLNGCDAFKARTAEEKLLAIKVEAVAAHAGTNPAGQTALEALGDALLEHQSSSGDRHHSSVALDQGVEVAANQSSALLWLFGSLENAVRMKTHYRRAPLALASPVERLHALVHDHLSDLEVPRMLAARLSEALDGDLTISLVLGGRKQVRRTGAFKVASVTQAQEMHRLGLSLSFPAPQRVTDLVVAPLTADMGFSRVGTEHRASIVSCRAEMALEWQFHRSETFVFVLQGSTQWKLKPGGAKHPLRCFHPPSRSLEAAADVVKVLALAEGPGGRGSALVSPPVDDGDDDSHVFDDMDEAGDDIEEKAVEAGAVVYMPAGTWFAVETAVDAVWLEVQLLPMTYEQVVLAALRPTLWRSDLWRMPLVLGGAQDHGRVAREHVGELLEDLKQKVAALTPNDVVPEYLMLDREGKVGPMSLEVDLRKGVPFPEASRHLKISGAMEFLVNPATVLLRADEIPHDGRAAAALPPVVSQPTAAPSTRALHKKPKRKTSMQVLRRADTHAYVLHSEFGNDAFKSKLRIEFRCSASQAALVEWIRNCEPLRSFSAEAFQAARGGMDAGAAKRVLRFLWCFGCVSEVKTMT